MAAAIWPASVHSSASTRSSGVSPAAVPTGPACVGVPLAIPPSHVLELAFDSVGTGTDNAAPRKRVGAGHQPKAPARLT